MDKPAGQLLCRARPRQDGAASLAVAVILLFAMTLLGVFASKSVSFAQKTAANHYRYTQAFEAAEAGFEVALARLRVPSLRTLYIDPATGLVRVGAPAVQASFGGGLSYKAAVNNPIVANPQLVLITANGYGDGCATFDDTCSVRAKVSQIVGFRRIVPFPPDSALTVRQNADLSGNSRVVNTDPLTGYTIRAGGPVTMAGASNLTTPSGTLPNATIDASVTQNDAGLAATTTDAFFQAFFGDTKEAIRALSEQYACAGTDCNAKLDGLAGRAIWVDGDAHLNAATVIGSPAEPVVLIVNGDLQMNGSAQVYGMVYAVSAGGTDLGGTPDVHGAMICESSFASVGNPAIRYDPAVLANLNNLGTYAKVLGTWADF